LACAAGVVEICPLWQICPGRAPVAGLAMSLILIGRDPQRLDETSLFLHAS
jgi:hypothetical protein